MSSGNAGGGGGGEGCCQTCVGCVSSCCDSALNADHDTAARYMRISNFLNAVLLCVCGIVYLVNPTSWARPAAPLARARAAGHPPTARHRWCGFLLGGPRCRARALVSLFLLLAPFC